ncbi:hypothetical protein [Sphingomonas quercus]|uniref:hypothetical protein n=1 Tax=Sphingomonas quercus TaxID=2842451 RepID=UPI001C0B0D12|nr:hypothetical protein [Sphingomonas quercus]
MIEIGSAPARVLKGQFDEGPNSGDETPAGVRSTGARRVARRGGESAEMSRVHTCGKCDDAGGSSQPGQAAATRLPPISAADAAAVKQAIGSLYDGQTHCELMLPIGTLDAALAKEEEAIR